MKTKARIIAYYLPQFHAIPENDKWWGEGFTEWTNVKKAKPLFKGHYQPRIPDDSLGYYDLLDPAVREKQAEMAREAGIEGFCYWHYWFGNGKRLLEKPFQQVLESGKPDFPFCLGWANHSWTNKTWKGKDSLVQKGTLMEQTYSEEDYVNHFHAVLPAFKDKRYIQVNGKPLFVIFDPLGIPDPPYFIAKWNELARQNGFEGVHFAGNSEHIQVQGKGFKRFCFPDQATIFSTVLEQKFNAVISVGTTRAEMKSKGYIRVLLDKIFLKMHLLPLRKYRHNYRNIIKYYHVKEEARTNVYPTIIPNWDRTPRIGTGAYREGIWHGSTPELFGQHVCNALDLVQHKPDEDRIIFLKSWNEWGEGNYIEPDTLFGKQYLETLKHTVVLS
ncbi:MAG: glycoside hydrolase family 99-like domain-containing protein [Tannerellaceae bacterium]|jgi:hypothetical protein|nr:glycoside hydrolase family 99-like domain-containing protein [Tannerellaceae bacterium]